MNTTPLDADRRMREMMRQLRADVLELCYDKTGESLEIAREICIKCGSVEACQAWLAANPTRWTPDFCPNHELFGRFKAT